MTNDKKILDLLNENNILISILREDEKTRFNDMMKPYVGMIDSLDYLSYSQLEVQKVIIVNGLKSVNQLLKENSDRRLILKK